MHTLRLCGLLSLAVLSSLCMPHEAGATVDRSTEWSEDVFRSAIKLLATTAEWHVLDTLPACCRAEYLERFWKRRDPTPTTPTNEFREQFIERVEHALQWFNTVPAHAPWDERGDVYIRFGPPDNRDVALPITFEDYEWWYYFSPPLKLKFMSKLADFRLVPYDTDMYGMDRVEPTEQLTRLADAKDRIRTTVPVYIMPLGVDSRELILACYPFRREDGDYDVYLASALPLRVMARGVWGDKISLQYVARATALDSSLSVRWSDSVCVATRLPRRSRHLLVENQWETVLPPGLYAFASEIEGVQGRRHASGALDRWLVPYLDSVALDLSPLVLALDIRPAQAGSAPFVRNGRQIVPMPAHVFKEGQDVAFYHEVYNLRPGDSGLCIYHVEYSLYNRGRQDRRVLTAQEFASHEMHTFQAGRIAHDRLHKGDFILEVKTRDLVAGTSKTALARLKIE